MRILLTVLFSSGLFAGTHAQSPALTQVKFEVQYNPGKLSEDIIADIYGDSLVVGIIPYQQADLNLAATFVAGAGGTVEVNGVGQVSTITINDFSSPVTYVVSSNEGTTTYKVQLIYTGLPLVYVYTQDAAPILNKDDYVSGTLKIYPNEEAEVYAGAMGIRGRGNTTWTFPKKPYRIKLGSAASILGMPSDKDWVLLANYADKSLMRNSLVFYLGEKMDLEYTPGTRYVDLVLNGAYQGNYVIGEHIKVDKDRVNIEELEEDDTEESVINGGYFLELDDYRDGTYFELTSGLPYVVKSPDDIPELQLEYIRNYMQQTEDAIFSDDFTDPDAGYAKFINTETFIEFYWVNELVKNIDARDVSSIFYYKDRDEKLNMGPLWDFDVAAGNASVNSGDDPTGFYVREAHWFKRLFEDPEFRTAAEARWFTLRDELLSNLPAVIDSFATKLDLSQKQNFYKWGILNEPIWPSTLVLGSYRNEVDYLRDWLLERIAWIDAQIEQPAAGIPVLHSPLPDEITTELNPGMKWFKSERAESYDLQISSEQSFQSLVADKTMLTDTTYSVTETLAEQTTYYWRVRASNATHKSEWSETWSFTTPLITGVGERAHGVSMFPNPTTTELHIEIPATTLIGQADLVDALGRTVISSELMPGATTKIDVSNFQRGLYMVILRGKLTKPLTSKVVLR